jgi:hypothetical protein
MNAISSRRPSRSIALLLATASALAPAIAAADVATDSTFTLDGIGGFSFLAMSGTSTQSLTSDKMRTDSNVQFKSRLVNMFAGKAGNTSSIVRLDKGVVYDLQHGDQKYTEMTFEQMQAAMQKTMQQMEEASRQQAATQPQQLPVDAQSCQMSEPVVEARKTGEHATIAGYDTERATVSLKQSCTDPATQKTCDMVWSIDSWLAPTAPGGDEARAFGLAYASRMGLDEASVKAMQNRMQTAYSQYKGIWSQVMEKSAEFQGYPLKSVMQISMGGAQCTTESGAQVAADPMFADAVDAGLQAGAGTAAGVAGAAAGQAAGEAVGGAAGGAVAGSAAGAFASKLGSSLMGKLRKKDKPAEATPATAATPAEGAPAGMIRLFRLTSETTAIRSGPIAADTFEVPAGYKLAK